MPDTFAKGQKRDLNRLLSAEEAKDKPGDYMTNVGKAGLSMQQSDMRKTARQQGGYGIEEQEKSLRSAARAARRMKMREYLSGGSRGPKA